MYYRVLLRPFKRIIAGFLRKTPISSKIIGPPKNTAQSTKTYFRNKGVKQYKYKIISPCTKVERNPPFKCEPRVHYKFTSLYHQIHKETFVTSIKYGRTWGQCGAIITPDDTLLRDISRESQYEEREHSACKCLSLGALKKTQSTVAVLTTVWANVYYHWMFDILPRFGLLKAAGLDKKTQFFVVPDYSLPFQQESLRTLGLNVNSLIVADSQWKFHLESKLLFAPSLVSALDTPTKWACNFIRTKFGNNAPQKHKKRRIYISRRHANGRRVLNESETISFLSSLGFELIENEKMTISEQAALFKTSEWIIAPHGAGLTNIVFCHPNTKIIDIFSPEYINPVYWVIANELQLIYGYLIGEGTRYPDGTDPENRQTNIIVNIKELKALIQKMS